MNGAFSDLSTPSPTPSTQTRAPIDRFSRSSFFTELILSAGPAQTTTLPTTNRCTAGIRLLFPQHSHLILNQKKCRRFNSTFDLVPDKYMYCSLRSSLLVYVIPSLAHSLSGWMAMSSDGLTGLQRVMCTHQYLLATQYPLSQFYLVLGEKTAHPKFIDCFKLQCPRRRLDHCAATSFCAAPFRILHRNFP